MKRITFFLFLFVGSICYSQDRIQLNNNLNDSLKVIKKTIKNYEDGLFQNEQIVLFTYENNLVSKIETTQNGDFIEDVEVKYENGNLKQMNLFYTTLRHDKKKIINPPTENVNAIYNYDDANLIITLSRECNGLKRIHYFTYNDAQQLITEKEIQDGITLIEKKYKYDKNGNLYNKKDFIAREYDYYKTYDDKKNPFSLIYPDAYLKVYKISKNNIISCNINGKSYTYEYEYNSSNYPVKIIEKNGRKIQSETIIEYRKI